MTNLNVKVRKVNPDAKLPTYATDGSGAFDLYAAEGCVIKPGYTVKIPLGLAFEIPKGYALTIAMRSGIAAKTSLRIPNAPALIDSDFRGEASVLLDNTNEDTEDWERSLLTLTGDEVDWDVGLYSPIGTYIVKPHDRIAQGFIIEFPRVTFTESDELSETERGNGGFGSSGV